MKKKKKKAIINTIITLIEREDSESVDEATKRMKKFIKKKDKYSTLTQREKDNLINQWLAYISEDFITYGKSFENDKQAVEYIVSRLLTHYDTLEEAFLNRYHYFDLPFIKNSFNSLK